MSHGNPSDDPENLDRAAGSALLLSVFVLLILSSMGLSLMFLSVGEIRMSQGSLRTQKAFFLAEAGQEDGRATLFAINGIDDFSDDLAGHAGPDGVLDFDPDNLQVVRGADGSVTGLTGYGDDRPLRSLTAFSDGWYAAFVNNDPAEGRTTTTDGNNRVMITGIGAGEDRAAEVVRVIVEKREILPTVPPATITLLGPVPRFHGGNANVHDYSGDDCGGRPPGVPGLYVPIVGTVGPIAASAAESDMLRIVGTDGNGGPDFASGPYEALDTFADLTDPGEPTVAGSAYGTLDPAWQDCPNIVRIIEDVRQAADVVCCTPPVCATPVPDPCVLPVSTADRTVFIDGDWTVGPGDSGAGTLLVTGRLRYNGQASWNGMLFAFGAGEYQRYGAGNGQVSGAIMVADVAGPDNIYGTDDDCTGGDAGFDSAYADLSGGGNADTLYCSADILAARPRPPYRIVSFQQD